MRKLNSKRFVITMVVAIAVTVAIVISAFSVLYSISEKSILDLWKNRAVESARDVDYYLTMPFDAVSFSALKINKMLSRGADSSEVLDYLHDETAIYASIIKENNTGVYAYYKGEYLDGSRWTPPADYQPTERPWYIEAYANGGAITLVQPFLNIQTNTMMMSVSQLLDDGESVVSMDVFLDGVQHMSEESADADGVEAVFVMDKSGFIIAHSEKSFVGQNIADGSTLYGRSLFEEYREGTKEGVSFEIRGGSTEYMAFSAEVNDNWDVVYVLNRYKLFRSLNYIYVVAGMALIVILSIIITVIVLFFNRAKETARLNNEIRAVADVYMDMAKVDFAEDRMIILRKSDDVAEYLDGDEVPFKETFARVVEGTAADQSREMLMHFVEPDALRDRLIKSNAIAHEYLNTKDQWVRLRFIVVDRDESRVPVHALMALESIDEDKKSQEKLRKLSETDAMTGIRNRGSGENLIKRAMADGTKGLFILLDADHFKSVNDDFGHGVGDKVIVALARCLVNTFRDTDIVFRLGGDEFAVYAEGVVDEETAGHIMDRLFKNVDSIDIPEMNGRKTHISVGATFYPADRNDSFEALYQRADAATYESKKTEGNAVTYKGYGEKND